MCITYFQELCRKGNSSKHESIIWLNHALKFNGKSLNYTHWSKSGLITKSQLYEDQKLNENGIYAKLNKKAGFIFEMQTIKKVLPERCAHTPEDMSVIQDDKTDILQYRLDVPWLGFKCLNELTSKD